MDRLSPWRARLHRSSVGEGAAGLDAIATWEWEALLITRQKKTGLILRNSPYSSEFLSSRLGVRHLEPDEVVAIPRVLVSDMSLLFDTPFSLVFDSRRPLS